MLGVGTGEALNEIAVSGRRVAGVQGALRPAPRGRAADARAVDGEDVSSRASTTARSARRSTTSPSSRSPSTSPPAARSSPSTPAARATASSAPPARAWSSTPRSSCPPSPRARRPPGRDPADIDNMIEIKMSYDRDPDAALENCRFWAPLSLTAEQKHSVDSALEMERLADELPIEQVAKRWIVASRPGRGRRADQALRRRGPQPPGVPRSRPRPGALPHPVRRGRPAEAAGLWRE